MDLLNLSYAKAFLKSFSRNTSDYSTFQFYDST